MRAPAGERIAARSVAIVATHPVLRSGLCSILDEEQPSFSTRVFDSVSSLLETPTDPPFSIVLLELRQTGLDPLRQLATLKTRWPQIPVLTIAYARGAESIADALGAGADGYILSDDRPDELRYAINALMMGRRHLCSSVCEVVIDGFLRATAMGRTGHSSGVSLTERERQVMQMIAAGLRTRDIATQLNLSPKTVEKHRASLMRKLGLGSAPAVAAYAIAHGFVTL
jgi:DNA-binding NarL/FixJ family response regulator